ncbi:hypothetical protein NUU61_002995 [Penicillium alfredii]|uniref:Uncharacterized protein n=1 Tax=Penicillium alfredii TaxID=1506179 RepID=A0A9W9FSQ5_9EURO|nr:uncharacterized protein NUU61_002995 [Penicillium alfredii]KAJ5105648.1 hypothetical protein NUU61_002995 [Penicillium alfredii]
MNNNSGSKRQSPELQLPSIRELGLLGDVSRSNRNGTGMPANFNDYPPYPVHGGNRFPDPSQNVLREHRRLWLVPPVNVQGHGHAIESKSTPELPRSKTSSANESQLFCIDVSPAQQPSLPYATPQPSIQHWSPNPEARAMPPTSEPRAQPRVNHSPNDNGNGNGNGNRNPQLTANTNPQRNASDKKAMLVKFTDVAAHTAKCDVCDNRNKNGMSRCQACGWQCCRKCLIERHGDRSHKSFTNIHVPEGEGGGTTNNQASPKPYPSATITSTAPAPLTQFGIGSFTTADAASTLSPPGALPAALTAELSDNMDESGLSDETLSWPLTDDEDRDEDLLLSEEFIHVRRNPGRAARPGANMAE